MLARQHGLGIFRKRRDSLTSRKWNLQPGRASWKMWYLSWTLETGTRFEKCKEGKLLGRTPRLGKGREVLDASILFAGAQVYAQVQRGPRLQR